MRVWRGREAAVAIGFYSPPGPTQRVPPPSPSPPGPRPPAWLPLVLKLLGDAQSCLVCGRQSVNLGCGIGFCRMRRLAHVIARARARRPPLSVAPAATPQHGCTIDVDIVWGGQEGVNRAPTSTVPRSLCPLTKTTTRSPTARPSAPRRPRGTAAPPSCRASARPTTPPNPGVKRCTTRAG